MYVKLRQSMSQYINVRQIVYKILPISFCQFIFQISKYVKVHQNTLECIRIYQDTSKYIKICQNMTKSSIKIILSEEQEQQEQHSNFKDLLGEARGQKNKWAFL